MFENLFLPYLYKNFKDNESELDNLNDPIDKCLKIKFDEVKQVYMLIHFNTKTFFDNYFFNIRKLKKFLKSMI